MDTIDRFLLAIAILCVGIIFTAAMDRRANRRRLAARQSWLLRFHVWDFNSPRRHARKH